MPKPRRLFQALAFALLTAYVGPARADELLVFPDGPKVGDKAPPLHLNKLLNAPTNADVSWAALKGKVVVLDFWATWCPPCIASIPHMNKLVGELKGDPVQFISITAQPEDVVRAFLKKNPLSKEDYAELAREDKALADSLVQTFQQASPIHAWIGLDDLTGQDPDNYYAGSTVSGYFFYGVPHCVVVDQNGVIAAYAHPLELNVNFLRAIAKGEHPPVPDPDLPPKQLAEWKQEVRDDIERNRQWPIVSRGATIQATISRSREWMTETETNKPGPTGRNPLTGGNLQFHQKAVSLADALKAVSEVTPTDRGGVPVMKFDVLSPLPSAPHDFSFSVPRDSFVTVFAQTVQAAFDLDLKRETQSVEVLRLRIVPKGPQDDENGKHTKVTENVNDPTHGKMAIPDQDGGAAGNLMYLVEHDFGKTIAYGFEHGFLQGIKVEWDASGGFEAFRKALRDQAGIELTPDKLETEIIHVRTKQK